MKTINFIPLFLVAFFLLTTAPISSAIRPDPPKFDKPLEKPKEKTHDCNTSKNGGKNKINSGGGGNEGEPGGFPFPPGFDIPGGGGGNEGGSGGFPFLPGFGNVPGGGGRGNEGGLGGFPFPPGFGNVPGGGGFGYGGPEGGFGNGVVRPAVVCKEEGPCKGKRLTCPAKCFNSYSWSDKNGGGGGGGGGCTMDCKNKCVVYC